VAGGQQGTVASGMALRRGDVADAAVTVLVVVQSHDTKPTVRHSATRLPSPIPGIPGLGSWYAFTS
jgi:hypothetical protein